MLPWESFVNLKHICRFFRARFVLILELLSIKVYVKLWLVLYGGLSWCSIKHYVCNVMQMWAMFINSVFMMKVINRILFLGERII